MHQSSLREIGALQALRNSTTCFSLDIWSYRASNYTCWAQLRVYFQVTDFFGLSLLEIVSGQLLVI